MSAHAFWPLNTSTSRIPGLNAEWQAAYQRYEAALQDEGRAGDALFRAEAAGEEDRADFLRTRHQAAELWANTAVHEQRASLRRLVRARARSIDDVSLKLAAVLRHEEPAENATEEPWRTLHAIAADLRWLASHRS